MKLDDEVALRRFLTATIRECPKSRPQIAEELTALTGQRVTVHMLNDFTAESKKSPRFPASFIWAFCEVVGNDLLMRHVLTRRLYDLLTLGEYVHLTLDEKTKRLLHVGSGRYGRRRAKRG